MALLAIILYSQPSQKISKTVLLPSSKLLIEPVPGAPQTLNSFPATMAISPDGKYLATLNAGYGSQESKRRQSIAILDIERNLLSDFPDDRLGQKAHQTYFLGLAFSGDGKKLYAPLDSLTDPLGEQPSNTGNGIAVYTLTEGKLAPSGFFKIPLQTLAAGKKQLPLNKKMAAGSGIPYPGAIAVTSSPQGPRLLVADNLSDDALLMDANTGEVLDRFDLSSGPSVPATYPYDIVATRDGRRAYVSLWNASQVAELDLERKEIRRKITLLPNSDPLRPGSHPTALLLSPDERFLYVALANADRVGVIEVSSAGILGYLATELPGQEHAGTYPNALAQSQDGKKLFVANAFSDVVAVFDGTFLVDRKPASWQIPKRAAGFVPTEWYPSALAVHGQELFIATAKGQGTGSNMLAGATHDHTAHPFICALLRGSLARIAIATIDRNLHQYTEEAVRSNLIRNAQAGIRFSSGKNPIKHVIYIIKENRTYDQVLGDLGVGDGDPELTLYGENITPNLHNIARQFGVVDNFYDSGEVSGDGHVWSTAAITSDYTQRTWQIHYRGDERNYDYEGEVSGAFPLEMKIADVNEPATGYLWTTLARHHISYRHYGEFISTRWCSAKRGSKDVPTAQGMPNLRYGSCDRRGIRPGEPLPPNVGDPKGGPSPWPWMVPVIDKNIPTKPELRDHFDPNYPDFELAYPDQLRADEFLNEFSQFVEARKSGKGAELPQFVLLRLPNDHTSGSKAGAPTPAAQVADNDLAVGRVVEAISKSPYWDDTAIFMVEDDAQNGVDHVDAHRSTAFVISKYSPRSAAADGSTKPFVDHTFYTTVSMVRTMEVLLGISPMNNNDAHAPVMAPLFSGSGQQPVFAADRRNLQNGLLYKMNPSKGSGAKESSRLDFSHADGANSVVLNSILWHDRKGSQPEPRPVHRYFPATADNQ